MQSAMKWIAGGFFAVFVCGFCSLLILASTGGTTGGIVSSLIAMVVGFWVAWMAKGELDDAAATSTWEPNTYRMGADEEEEERAQVSVRRNRHDDDWDAIRPDDPNFDGE